MLVTNAFSKSMSFYPFAISGFVKIWFSFVVSFFPNINEATTLFREFSPKGVVSIEGKLFNIKSDFVQTIDVTPYLGLESSDRNNF